MNNGGTTSTQHSSESSILISQIPLIACTDIQGLALNTLNEEQEFVET